MVSPKFLVASTTFLRLMKDKKLNLNPMGWDGIKSDLIALYRKEKPVNV